MKKRKARIHRRTNETDITVLLTIDGRGFSKIDTGIGFLDHMLTLFAKHGIFDLEIMAKGDLKVDLHHTNEDVGICLGQAFKKALGQKKGIRRFGYASIPMDDAWVEVAVDIGGRPVLSEYKDASSKINKPQTPDAYTFYDVKEFLRAFVNNLGFNLAFSIKLGDDLHHVVEAMFKALALALDQATQIDQRIKGIPSTKGRL